MHKEITAIIETLEQRSGLQSLNPELTWNAALEQQVEALKKLGSSTEMITLIAALHLRNDSLDLSHSYAQQIEHDTTGAYWHGIMHRMEGDYPNAKYWFWQAERHPVMQLLKQRVADWLQQHWQSGTLEEDDAAESLPESGRADAEQAAGIMQAFQQGGWNSAQFCDLVQMSRGLGAAATGLLQSLQAIEIEALFQYTLRANE